MNKGYIYLITNKLNGKMYVGQTLMTVHERWLRHCSVARNNINATGIDGAIRKYGKEIFLWKPLRNVLLSNWTNGKFII